MSDESSGEDAGHLSGIHGPDCNCNSDITVPKWLSLHIVSATGADELFHEASTYAAVTGDAVTRGMLPSLVLYTAHTVIAMRGRGWVPEDQDSRIMADPTVLEPHRAEIRTAFTVLQRVFELANTSLWAEEETACDKAHDEALTLIENVPTDDAWWISVLTCDMGVLAVHEMEEIERFLWMNIADRAFNPHARPRLYNPHVVVALARLGGTLARREDHRVQHWWSFYGDMRLQPRILEAMLLELGDSAIPGETPSLIAMDSQGIPQAMLDPYTTEDSPSDHLPLEDLRAMRLVAQTVISIGNGEPFDMEDLHDKAGDLMGAVAMSLIRSFGFHVAEAWHHASQRMEERFGRE